MKIGYTFVIADLLHYGHLQLLAAAKKTCDRFICGLLTDEAVRAVRGQPVSSYDERKMVLEAIRYVDEVVPQESQDPTENLKTIKARHPEDEIIFVYGDNWKTVPGNEYLLSARVKTVRQQFYERLSNEKVTLKIIETVLPDRSVFETFTAEFAIKDFESFRKERPAHLVSTKARTLQMLKPLLKKSSIEKTYVFTVREWAAYQKEILYSIRDRFRGDTIIVRSSSLNEDSPQNSMAGYYHSQLDVDSADRESVRRAVEKTISSYGGEAAEKSFNQVLVQRQTRNVYMSGVVFTVDLETSSPYYVVNYDTGGKTDTVTAGQGGSLAKIFRRVSTYELAQPWRDLIEAVKEIEEIIPKYPLDIEFGVRKNGTIVLFQVRPLAAALQAEVAKEEAVEGQIAAAEEGYLRAGGAAAPSGGEGPVLSDMIFWNPAELLGHRPSNLAYGIFERIIMERAWSLGLRNLGYHDACGYRLMERLLQKPYINANVTFLALVPGTVEARFRHRLHDYYLEKLKSDHSLHDKAEFEIMLTCYDFTSPERMKELAASGFTPSECGGIEGALVQFTRGLLEDCGDVFARLKNDIDRLEEYNRRPLSQVLAGAREEGRLRTLQEMFDRCERLGAVPFCSVARGAFIAEAILKSLVPAGVISGEEYAMLMNSFHTVASRMIEDINSLPGGGMSLASFLDAYGHLRSGTYDIEKRRYDQMEPEVWLRPPKTLRESGAIDPEVKERVGRFSLQSPLGISFDDLYRFASLFIAGREHFKFVYTKTVSNALEIIREAGGERGFAARDLSRLHLGDLVLLTDGRDGEVRERIGESVAESALSEQVNMPPLVFGKEGFRIIEYPSTTPNFVTEKSTAGEVLLLKGEISDRGKIGGRIIFVENADPGWHWIFSENLAGLVTKYGGAASHMAICCAEFGVPAAIGSGELFDRLKTSRSVLLDCREKVLKEQV